MSYDCCAYYGEGYGPIWLDGFSCPAGASGLSDCNSFTWGRHDCRHYEDASVSCTDGEDQRRVLFIFVLLESQSETLLVKCIHVATIKYLHSIFQWKCEKL